MLTFKLWFSECQQWQIDNQKFGTDLSLLETDIGLCYVLTFKQAGRKKSLKLYKRVGQLYYIQYDLYFI